MINHLMEQIEAREFAFDFSVCSGMNCILGALETTPLVSDLLTALQDNSAVQQTVFERISQLVADKHLPYENRHDIAILVYIYALFCAGGICEHNDVIRLMRHIIIQPDLFWPRLWCARVLKGEL